MLKRRFVQCDVFSSIPTKGNGLAVVVDGEGLSDQQMQDFACWTNLAETTFILPSENSEADYLLKIFTPSREMLFAGHPTLGSCAAWLHHGNSPKQLGKVMQECGVGLVEIDLTEDVPAFVSPPTTIEEMSAEDYEAIIAALEIDPSDIVQSAKLTNGPVWHALELKSAEHVLGIDSSKVKWPEFAAIGLIGLHPKGAECDYEVRMLAPSSGMSEDPITGSLNSALACWLSAQGRLMKSMIVAQGTKINRHGRVYIRTDAIDKSKIFIGGHTKILIDGHVTL